jgi:hypothetical protein
MIDHQREQRPAQPQLGQEGKGLITDVVMPMVQNATDAGVAAGVGAYVGRKVGKGKGGDPPKS